LNKDISLKFIHDSKKTKPRVQSNFPEGSSFLWNNTPRIRDELQASWIRHRKEKMGHFGLILPLQVALLIPLTK
jgi:hypothetical protein